MSVEKPRATTNPFCSSRIAQSSNQRCAQRLWNRGSANMYRSHLLRGRNLSRSHIFSKKVFRKWSLSSDKNIVGLTRSPRQSGSLIGGSEKPEYGTFGRGQRMAPNMMTFVEEVRRVVEGTLVLLAVLFLTGQVTALSRGLTNRMRRSSRLREGSPSRRFQGK